MPERSSRMQWQLLSAWIAVHRRSLSGLLMLGVLGLCALWATRWLSDPQRYPLNVVEVTGNACRVR